MPGAANSSRLPRLSAWRPTPSVMYVAMSMPRCGCQLMGYRSGLLSRPGDGVGPKKSHMRNGSVSAVVKVDGNAWFTANDLSPVGYAICAFFTASTDMVERAAAAADMAAEANSQADWSGGGEARAIVAKTTRVAAMQPTRIDVAVVWRSVGELNNGPTNHHNGLVPPLTEASVFSSTSAHFYLRSPANFSHLPNTTPTKKNDGRCAPPPAGCGGAAGAAGARRPGGCDRPGAVHRDDVRLGAVHDRRLRPGRAHAAARLGGRGRRRVGGQLGADQRPRGACRGGGGRRGRGCRGR